MQKQIVRMRQTPGALTANVVKSIRENVASGALVSGQYVPSERDLAEQFGVSRVTVRRGFDQLVRDGVLVREPGRGYCVQHIKPYDAAGRDSLGSAIVFVHEHSEAELVNGTQYARTWAGAREEATRAGFLTMISSIPAAQVTQSKASELSRVAAGILCDHPNVESIRTLRQAGCPVILMEYYCEDMSCDVVIQDDAGGIIRAVEYLVQHGHREIGYLDATALLRAVGLAANAERRRSGFLLACERHGIDARHLRSINRVAEDAGNVTAGLLDAGVTALVVPHHDLWPSVRAQIQSRGIPVPGPLGLVVWGEPAESNKVDAHPTYITWNKEQMGREAVQRLIRRIARTPMDVATVTIPTQLVDCQSGGFVKAGRNKSCKRAC